MRRYLRDFVAQGRRAGSVRSYAYDLASLDRLTRNRNRAPVALGMPIIPGEGR